MFLASNFAGCCFPLPRYEPADDPSMAARLRERIPKPPDGTRMTLRAVLTTRGMELPFRLQVWRKLPDHYRAILSDDLGGTAFHVVQRGAEFLVVARSENLDEAFVRDGLCQDLAYWLFMHVTTGDEAVRVFGVVPPPPDVPAREEAAFQERSKPGLHRVVGDRHALLWSSTADGPIDRIATGLEHRLHSMIELEWDEGRPTNALIQNYRFGFTLSLEVKEWQAADLTAKTFRTR